MNYWQRSGGQYGLTLNIIDKGTESRTGLNGGGLVAEIGKEIVFDASVLDTYHYAGWKPVHHDLLVVCAAVEFADRRRPRRATQWSRWFQITIPVFERDAWDQAAVRRYLHDTLRHLTGDDWQFSFRQAKESTVEDSVRQRMLPFRENKEFVIAYSNGIDSRCVSGILDARDSVVRVRLTRVRDRAKHGERPFDQIPFAVKTGSGETDVRSRAFKFAAITAIAAHLCAVGKIVVPESGQEAIGPSLLPLHNTYPDYRNHPTFFRKMERFIQELLGFSVSYEQPRLWNTKGETIRAFAAKVESGRESVMNTRSCWQQRWNARFDGKLGQCGLCAACLLRRMSMHAAEIEEPAGIYFVDDLTRARYEDARPQQRGGRLSRTLVEYGSVGARHLQQLADRAEVSDTALRPFVFEIARATSTSEHETLEGLRRLLLQHASEWRAFCRAQGPRSFIVGWAKGAPHAGSE